MNCDYLTRSFFYAEDTSSIHARNFEVIKKLNHFLSAGVTGIRVSHLGTHTNTHSVVKVVDTGITGV